MRSAGTTLTLVTYFELMKHRISPHLFLLILLILSKTVISFPPLIRVSVLLVN
jgi:hypothetical protein